MIALTEDNVMQLSASINARIRRAVRARGHFPNEQAALNAFEITFDGRLSAGRR